MFFSYDVLGNRLSMTEKNGAATVRKATYGYDRMGRLTSAGFDWDGNGTVEETVGYAYDGVGQRTTLTLPDGKTVSYSYDARGRLTSLTDWASQSASYSYDGASRLVSRTANGITMTQVHDAAGRLLSREHKAGATLLSSFIYTLNARGDRTQKGENIRQNGGAYDNGAYYMFYDGQRRVRQVMQYGSGGSGPLYEYDHAFDVAGNRTQEVVRIDAAETTTDYEYDDANRMTRRRVNAGAWTNLSYDNAGRMTSDGTNTYAWDRANRLLSMGGASYAYDGAGRRIAQTVSGVTTNYLLDGSMDLWETLTATTGANVTRYVHDPLGVLAQHDGTSWDWMLADGLGSVRNVVDGSANVLWSSHYAPYGSPYGGTGTSQTAYGFTGEPTDGNGLVYLRNRYYAPGIGIFASIDPLETANRYAYVGGNVVNATDPSGLLMGFGGTNTGKSTGKGTGAVKPLEVKKPPVTPWAWNTNPNPTPVAPWGQNANPNPTPYTPPTKTTHGVQSGSPTDGNTLLRQPTTVNQATTFENMTPGQQLFTSLLQGVILDVVYDVDLTNPNGGIFPWLSWYQDGNGPARVNEAYRAVTDIMRAIAAEATGGNYSQAVDVFRRSLGGTDLQLVPGNASAATEDRLRPDAAASTSTVGREPPVIYLYQNPEGAGAGFVHSRQNIVHEFGHAFVRRTSGLPNNPAALWDQINTVVSPFASTEQGWLNAIDLRQNRYALDSFVGPTAVQQYREEQIADMFLYWTYGNGRQPSGSVPYQFDVNNPDDQTRRRAEALENFIYGGTWTDVNPAGTETLLQSPGAAAWLMAAAQR